ncbi:TPA: FAD-dependent oxidoreductase [Streptococcus agalactiae]
MKKYDVIVLGFGKAGKTLAAKLATQGKSVAMVEEDDKMYGGTCINIGCIPTKTLLVSASKNHDFQEAMTTRNEVTSRLRAKNFAMLDNKDTVDVYNAKARFISNKVVELTGGADSQHVYDSTAIQELAHLPKRLGIIGGGNIGLEFATLYSELGSKVTVIDSQSRIFAREEEELSEMAQDYLEEMGISFKLSADIKSVQNEDEDVVISFEDEKLSFDAVLYATGRKPNTEGLALENTDIKLTERGAIAVDEYCQTSVENIFAVGDVNGGPQFTYISLDDSRIVLNYLNGDKDYSLKNRGAVPTSTFTNPPLATVGLDEKTAKEKGYQVKSNSLLVSAMPRAHVNNDLRGIFKVVVDTETNLILGARLFGAESHELINIITMAMDNKIPYTYFQKQIFTHPTMVENFNDLFNF